jgi:bifunctional DNA-binding transcriptional regulator/antitoxin component of YhaV-PrlF toxin-antitoxin module
MKQMKKYLRNLYALGRIAIPKEILQANLIDPEALFYIKTIPEGILLVPADGSCALCGGVEALLKTDLGFLCRKCLELAKVAETSGCID